MHSRSASTEMQNGKNRVPIQAIESVEYVEVLGKT